MSEALNALIRKKVIPPVVNQLEVGNEIEVVGAIKLSKKDLDNPVVSDYSSPNKVAVMLLEVRNISKIFPGVKALDQVSLKFYPGEVNALLGENGAGKSTLLKVLTGVYTQYEGTILLDDEAVRFGSVREAQEAGIAIIHQELNLIPQLTVAENLFLGRELRNNLGLMDTKEMNRQTQAMLEKLNLNISPQTPVRRLKVGEQQLVEIAKALLTDAAVILMDEPTSALSDTEIENLHQIIHALKQDRKNHRVYFP